MATLIPTPIIKIVIVGCPKALVAAIVRGGGKPRRLVKIHRRGRAPALASRDYSQYDSKDHPPAQARQHPVILLLCSFTLYLIGISCPPAPLGKESQGERGPAGDSPDPLLLPTTARRQHPRRACFCCVPLLSRSRRPEPGRHTTGSPSGPGRSS